MSSRCWAGSMSGTPLWCRSKCSPLGVIMPSRDSRGVRDAPLPVVPGCERMNVRVTLLSYFAGVPYSPIPAPGAFIDGGISGGSTASTCLSPAATSPEAARNPTPRLMKRRLDASTLHPLVTPQLQPGTERPLALAIPPPERHALEPLGVLHARRLAVSRRPRAQELVDPLALAHLRDVRLQRGALECQRVGDVDVGVRAERAADEDFLHLMRLEPLGQELLEDHARLGRRKDRVERRAGDGAVVGMVQVIAAVPAHRRVAAHHDVRLHPADHAREIAPERDGRLDLAVLIAE